VRRLAAVAAAVLGLAGCGVPADRQPRQIASRNVPFELLAPSTTTSSTVPRVATSATVVYLISGDRVGPVTREVLAPPVLSRVLVALLRGPTAEESQRGVRTALPRETRVLSAGAQAGTAVVDLSGELAGVSGPEQILALAQLVFTVTEQPGISAVRFSVEGQPVEVPRADGTLTADPLRRADFAPLLVPG
jgi:spore germination protein GerM